jgi:hypothetical protein
VRANFRKKDQPNRVWGPRWQPQSGSMLSGNRPQCSVGCSSETLKSKSSLDPCLNVT